MASLPPTTPWGTPKTTQRVAFTTLQGQPRMLRPDLRRAAPPGGLQRGQDRSVCHRNSDMLRSQTTDGTTEGTRTSRAQEQRTSEAVKRVLLVAGAARLAGFLASCAVRIEVADTG